MVFLFTSVVRLYQRLLSPLLPPLCRFHPTCSDYACQSVRRHGFLRGFGMTLKRLARCHPDTPGGYDPVH